MLQKIRFFLLKRPKTIVIVIIVTILSKYTLQFIYLTHVYLYNISSTRDIQVYHEVLA